MIEVSGKYNSAKIFTDVVDQASIAPSMAQLVLMLLLAPLSLGVTRFVYLLQMERGPGVREVFHYLSRPGPSISRPKFRLYSCRARCLRIRFIQRPP